VSRFLLLLLVLLVPLRALSAETMALRMAANGSPAAVMAQGDEKPSAHAAMDMPSMKLAPGAMPDDCPMMAAAAGEGTPVHDSGATDSQGLGGHCNVCQLCMSLAGVDCVPIRSPGVGTLKPEPHASRFSSADPAREHRPPIS
jgi:hypothetical protein